MAAMLAIGIAFHTEYDRGHGRSHGTRAHTATGALIAGHGS